MAVFLFKTKTNKRWQCKKEKLRLTELLNQQCF